MEVLSSYSGFSGIVCYVRISFTGNVMLCSMFLLKYSQKENLQLVSPRCFYPIENLTTEKLITVILNKLSS